MVLGLDELDRSPLKCFPRVIRRFSGVRIRAEQFGIVALLSAQEVRELNMMGISSGCYIDPKYKIITQSYMCDTIKY